MIDFLLESGNLPFTIALAVMLALAALEGVGMVLGLAVSEALEAILPNVDLDAPDVQPGVFSRLLGWMRFGQVPALMILVVLLTAFGLIGLGLQQLSAELLGFVLPAPIAAVPALLVALPIVRACAGAIAAILPKDETEVVSNESFIGRVAAITLGTAEPGRPAQARLKDQHGQTHYVMVEPDLDGENFPMGTEVVLVAKPGVHYRAIRNTHAALAD